MQIAHTKYGDIEYRLAGRGTKIAVLLHGGHMNAGIHLGEDYFVENGYKVIIVSRPGYGETPLSTGVTADDFADALGELFLQLNIKQAIVIGISAGGRAAMRLAARYPTLVKKLILQSSISFAQWPDRYTKIAVNIAFNSFSERYIWGFMRLLLKMNPKSATKMMIANMTTLDPENVVKNYNKKQLRNLVQVFANSSSGYGFANDIKSTNVDATDVTVPTLIIHSKYDKSVSLDHPRLLAQQIKNSYLYISEAESHMIWFSPHYVKIKEIMSEFLSE